ncbi:hypothetical protein ASPCAL03256 [Aspergillus calidoustus]|uniref:3beta-hydroxysteroid 3-dehydrogenase n=1 Tax=Aspergillus calidoustus TaxID=454130 RepID=A0A0U5GUJ3_ASPCI|nr:hypothetical protein ASPCAL03256 [Aspergillus calidoustus]
MTGTVLLTGANGSLALGFVEAFLAQYPGHTLIATVRNTSPEKDPNTAKLMQLVAKHPGADVHVEALDLGNLAGVRSYAENVAARVSSKELPRISAIVCNAATWSLGDGQRFTSDGHEASFQVNHLAHYLLVLKLLGSMNTTSGRVVMLGSIVHYPEKRNPLSSLVARIPDNMEELLKPEPDAAGQAHDRGFQRYGTSKLANVIFAEDLNSRLQQDPELSNITVTAVDPGGLPDSRGQVQQRRAVRVIMATLNVFMPVLRYVTTGLRTSKDSGRDLVAVSVGSEFQAKRGYYVGVNKAEGAQVSHDEQVQRRLWEACWKWAGLSPEETVLQNAAP